MIKDKIIKILDRLPEEELENVLWAIEHIEKRYLHNWNLFGKGVTITNLFEESEKIIARWDSSFAGKLSEEMKASIYYDQFKWHIFSYEKQDCVIGEAARSAFDLIKKHNLYVMHQRSPYVTLLSNASQVTALDFDNEQDVYIFDKSFSWTYVNTHESDCGPYFSRLYKDE